MECKKCKAQLEPGVTFCPECGTDSTPEAPKGITLTPGKLVAVIAAVVLLTAAVVALILTGMGYQFTGTKTPEATETAPTLEAALSEATIPADGNPDDVTCKGSYTVSDDEVTGNKAAVVATVGGRDLTNAELQIYYWLEVQKFLSSYGSYMSMLGMDYTQPLDTQSCSFSETPMTWQQYFLDAALANWHNYAALAEEADANGYQMDQEYLDMIQGLPESLETDAALQGFADAEAYLAYNVGAGASVADYQGYMTTYYQGFMYFQSMYEAMVPTDEELETYFAEHEAEYAESGINKTDYAVDVRHILILPEGATLETIYTDTFPEEAWAVGEAQAQAILDEWLSGEKTEETFAEMANKHSVDPGSNTNGGLYTDVATGDMVEAFDAWCFDEARVVGDYGIVRTELGFHIMYLSAVNPTWKTQVTSDILSDRGSSLIFDTAEKYPMTVKYGKIMLGFVDLNK